MGIATDEEDIQNGPDNLISTLVTPNQDIPTPVERTKQLLEDLQPESEILSEKDKDKWRAFLTEYNHLFTLNKSELGSTNVITHSIDTGDHPPIRQTVRHTHQQVDNLVQEMLNQGITRPSQSPWASTILVKKNDGTTRFCVDYRKLNSLTRKDVLPLTRIDNTLDFLSQSVYSPLQSGFRVLASENG